MSKRQKENIILILVNIFFIVVCFLVLVPVLYALSVSLNADNSLLSADFSFLPKHVTLQNYHAVFFEKPILLWLKRDTGCVCFFKKKISRKEKYFKNFNFTICIPIFAFYDSVVQITDTDGTDQYEDRVDYCIHGNNGSFCTVEYERVF